MDYAEGADHTLAVYRQQVTNNGQCAVTRTTIRLHERTSGGANACAAHRIAAAPR